MGNKIKITLTVANASGLYALAQPVPQTVLESFCELSDDNNGSSPNGGGIEQFESTASIDKDVTWQGVTSSQGYTIAIDTIVYEPNVNNDVDFFDTAQLPPPPRGPVSRNEDVTAKVKNDESLKGRIDVYKINFRIYQSSRHWKAYSIDPRLKIDR